MSAKLQYNPDHSAFAVTVGETCWGDDCSKTDDFMILPDGANSLCVVLEGSELEGVEPNTVYRLVKIDTELLPDGDIDEDDEAGQN
jgi:hypothetical protein